MIVHLLSIALKLDTIIFDLVTKIKETFSIDAGFTNFFLNFKCDFRVTSKFAEAFLSWKNRKSNFIKLDFLFWVPKQFSQHGESIFLSQKSLHPIVQCPVYTTIYIYICTRTYKIYCMYIYILQIYRGHTMVGLVQLLGRSYQISSHIHLRRYCHRYWANIRSVSGPHGVTGHTVSGGCMAGEQYSIIAEVIEAFSYEECRSRGSGNTLEKGYTVSLW